MHNCSDDVLAHHDEEVTLPQAKRTNMRDRRDANRNRLKTGLKKNEKPAPCEFVKQGSYAMKTMVQHPNNDYDIDDGVYFNKEELVGDRGAEMSGLQVRQMVRDALDDGSFKKAPEVRSNCVRAYYAAGYHVDLPAYRRVTVTGLPGQRNVSPRTRLQRVETVRRPRRDRLVRPREHRKSPDTTNGRQLRRLVRRIKKYARSRPSWSGQILGGFGITALVVECYRANLSREDTALYDSMSAIRNRLKWNLTVKHPATPNETITKGDADARAKFLRDRLTEAIKALDPLFDPIVRTRRPLKCWDKVFSATFFSDRDVPEKDANAGLLKTATVAPSASAFTFPNVPRRDDKPRGFG